MEWVASTLTPPPNVVYPALLTLMRTPRLPAVDWTDAPTDLNGLVRFEERRNLVSARVPSRSAWAILLEKVRGKGGGNGVHESNPQRHQVVLHHTTHLMSLDIERQVWSSNSSRRRISQLYFTLFSSAPQQASVVSFDRSWQSQCIRSLFYLTTVVCHKNWPYIPF